MAAPTPSRPRKRPVQARSQAMVRTLLDAAAATLEEAGIDGLTTNRVAGRAGVSVGSLYQYFPNKESMVLALLERHLREAQALRPAALARADLPLEERIRLVVGWFLASHAAAPDLHRSLTLAAPSVLGHERVARMERVFHRTVLEALRPYAREIRSKDLELASFVVAQCLEALTHGAVIHHPELLVGGRLAGEISALLLRYLRRAPARARRRTPRAVRRTPGARRRTARAARRSRRGTPRSSRGRVRARARGRRR